MNFIDFDYLLQRMVLLEHAAFEEFDDVFRDAVANWLREFGLAETDVARETPNCLLALGVMVVQRRAEIEKGRALVWLRVQTRNLVVRYWREAERQSPLSTQLTADRAHRQVCKLDGSTAAYSLVARELGVPSVWLRRRHRQLVGRMPGTSPAGGLVVFSP